MPGTATLIADQSEPVGSYDLPTGPWADGKVPTQGFEGGVTRRVWRIEGAPQTTLQILGPLRDELVAQGFRILLDCDTDACGGFDFRFGTQVLPEPDMHVDLGNFRFLSAERDGKEGPEAVSLFVSRSAVHGFVQMISVGVAVPVVEVEPAPVAPVVAATAPVVAAVPKTAADIGAGLGRTGSVALDDLVFASGAAQLDAGDYASLAALADWLSANPGYKVMLVGHTDVSGGLSGNVALSKARAASVRDRLIQSYGVAADRVQADGVGYLAPRAPNVTPEDRARNRRVEVMIIASPPG
ncbi:OmpA family protein [Tabrizicola sp. J26]|uniref:OmpA family protein n=1 Tax=Alitabrizicola rongguiensis TaxID=2909234 RepID=UPI001F1EEE6E|nr:OmpA family protein [Tabrizicola rongguiensis]MCF1707721.1 OmpA family protein [Tabrizicola rongguiensis]